MNILNSEEIAKFAKKHANSRSSLNSWYDITIDAEWNNFEDVKNILRTADRYGRCVVFNIGGNNYRLIARINYRTQQVYITAIMTHAEYDKEKWKDDC
jgi:mRNA interferase HigB